jgi:hypothetical protein
MKVLSTKSVLSETFPNYTIDIYESSDVVHIHHNGEERRLEFVREEGEVSPHSTQSQLASLIDAWGKGDNQSMTEIAASLFSKAYAYNAKSRVLAEAARSSSIAQAAKEAGVDQSIFSPTRDIITDFLFPVTQYRVFNTQKYGIVEVWTARNRFTNALVGVFTYMQISEEHPNEPCCLSGIATEDELQKSIDLLESLDEYKPLA